jgi:hypothetical protein
MAVAKKGDLGNGASVKTVKGFYVKSWLGRYVIAKSPTFKKQPSPAQIWNRQQFPKPPGMPASP